LGIVGAGNLTLLNDKDGALLLSLLGHTDTKAMLKNQNTNLVACPSEARSWTQILARYRTPSPTRSIFELLLANFGKEATTEPIIGKFSQETLAEMIGTTRSRVSFFMNKFRKLGYIEYNGKLEIRNSLLNVVLYDKPEIRKNDASEGPRYLPTSSAGQNRK
jgi:Crp-like helix-turn-helix protein